jgi:hypothetical protein
MRRKIWFTSSTHSCLAAADSRTRKTVYAFYAINAINAINEFYAINALRIRGVVVEVGQCKIEVELKGGRVEALKRGEQTTIAEGARRRTTMAKGRARGKMEDRYGSGAENASRWKRKVQNLR